MAKYIFKKLKDENNPYDKTNITLELEAESLTELFEAFEDFLKGSGFQFSGTIDTVEDEQ